MADTARNSQLLRLIALIRDLDRLGGIDVYELSKRHQVTPRTIHRDIDALRDAGIPLEAERDGKRKRLRVTFKSSIRQVSQLLDADHYLALRLAMGQGGAVRSNSSSFAQLEDLAGKIENAIGPAGRTRLAAIEACFHSYEKFAWTKAPADVLWLLVDAISEKRVCRVKYAPAQATKKVNTYEVLPLKVFAHDGASYLLCYYPKREKVLTLNLHRLVDLTVTKSTGTPPAGFEPTQYERAAFGVTRGGPLQTWELQFDPNVAPYIRERVWHPSQTLTEHADGSVTLRFSCEGEVEVFAWVASWRDGVQILAPIAARQQMRDFGNWLRKTYARPAVATG